MRLLFYNELEESLKISEKGFSEGHYSTRDAILFGKYLRWEKGYGDAKIKTELRLFCEKYDPFFVWDNNLSRLKIKYAVKMSRKEFIDKSSPVIISNAEIDTIRNSDLKYNQKKILFGILVLATRKKGYFQSLDYGNLRAVLKSRITNIQIINYIRLFIEKKFLDININTKQPFLIIPKSDDVGVEINGKNIYELGDVFVGLFGEDLFECCDCHKPTLRHSSNQVRCHKCSRKRRREKGRLYTMESRQKT
jgi:hypothetical protein